MTIRLKPPLVELVALAALARLAGQEIERFKRAGYGARFKDDGSLVTEADHAAEAIILDGLERLAPDVPVVAEERAAIGQDPRCEGRFFLVDPLDGTRDFVESDLGEYAVNIALVEAGRARLGVIYAPAFDVAYAGGPGEAFVLRQGVMAPLARHEATAAANGLRAVASRRAHNGRLAKFLAEVAPGEPMLGSSALKFTQLARGEAQLYPRFSPVSEWDVCAGDALLSALGGGVMGIDGQPLRYGQRDRRYQVDGFIAFSDGAARQAALTGLSSAA